ncbi:MAG: hypothetical protein P8Y12_12885 [Gammaproteobacteria bacterium]
MISERILELINADMDGELRPEDQSELDAALESSAEARAVRSELQKLSSLMDNLPPQQPPGGLGSRIARNIELPKPESSFSLSSLFSSFQPATAGVAFAAGLLLAAGFYEFSSERAVPGDSASMVGTMIAGKRNAPEFLKNDMQLKGDGFSGTISLRETSGIYILNFDSGGAMRVLNQGHQQFAVFLREDEAGKPVQPGSISIDFLSSDRL